jgi:hypothetical protein
VLDVGLTTPRHKNKPVMKRINDPRTWTDSLYKRPKRRNKDMSLYRAGSLMTAWRELSRYRLGLVEVQVRWEGVGTRLAEHQLFYG